MIVDTDDAIVSSQHSPSAYRWLAAYRYFMYAAVALGSISIVLGILSWRASDEFFRTDSFLFFRFFVLPIGLYVAGIGLFIFAIYSLKRLSEPWVRNLHLWIHGAAVILVLPSLVISAVNTFGPSLFILGEPSSVAQLASFLGQVVVIPLAAIVPWDYLYQTFPPVEQGSTLVQNPVFTLVQMAVFLATLSLAATWYVLWTNVLGVSKRLAFWAKVAWTTLAVVLSVGMLLIPIMETVGYTGLYLVLAGLAMSGNSSDLESMQEELLQFSFTGIGIILIVWIGGLLLARKVIRRRSS